MAPMAPPDFDRSVNPISTKGVRLCPPNNSGTPGFSDLPTALIPTGHLYYITFYLFIIYLSASIKTL